MATDRLRNERFDQIVCSTTQTDGRSAILGGKASRVGSRTVRIITNASTIPGMPTTMKAVRQPNSWLIQPPAARPNSMPTGTPQE